MTCVPAAAPCVTCPYRRDVPAGVWHPDEYAELPPYDGDTATQPTGLFFCHQKDGRLCAGWVAVHDMHESLALRIGALSCDMTDDDIDQILEYVTDVPLFRSGREAADHGLGGVDEPGEDARAAIDRLKRKRVRSDADA